MPTTAESLMNRLWDEGVVPGFDPITGKYTVWTYPGAAPPSALLEELRTHEADVRELLRIGHYRFPPRPCCTRPDTQPKPVPKGRKR